MTKSQFTLNRRHALGLASAWLLPVTLHANAWAASAKESGGAAPASYPPLAALEKKVGGRLGVAILNTASGATVGHRLDERFGMCSTFKLPLAAAILRKADQGTLRLDQWVPYTQADMVSHAPVTQANLHKGGMTVGALAEAAQTTSDNPAANLLLGLIGGPAGFTALMREAGDTITRLDRLEPHMNAVGHADPRDTTTPAAMAANTARMLLGDWLSAGSRATLIDWMVATGTGAKRLRAGFPAHWRAGDKTGTGMSPGLMDKYNDIAIAWPPGKAPLIVTAYYETAKSYGGKMRDEDQAVLAEVGRIASRWSTA
ncbi:MAG: class A beta-lactamase [Burkholderiales bacterium PBB3]|nr:MAG: class A beta-lactamase [Burkholderiales bacterium PBB3]